MRQLYLSKYDILRHMSSIFMTSNFLKITQIGRNIAPSQQKLD